MAKRESEIMSRAFDPIHDPVDNLPPFSMINASAGTGKTWTVTHLAARWLLEVPGRSPSNLLLVTFAREAAGELKGRLRGRLEEFADEIQTPTSREPWALHLATFVNSVGKDEMLRRCSTALHDLDDLNARTIHSFASVVNGSSTRFVDNTIHLRNRSAREAITWASLNHPDAFRRLLGNVNTTGNQVSRLNELVVRALGIGLPLGGFHRESLVQFMGITDFMTEDDRSHLETFQRIIEEAARREAAIRASDRTTTHDAAIGDLVNLVQRNPADARRRLGDQFQFVIIDEFQDTDSGQWTVFSELFMEGPNPVPVLVVGDAKQAIYSFRGGDVTIMQRRQGDIERDERLASATLDVNYRSHSRLLDQLNSFYCPNGQPHTFLDAGDAPAIAYEPVRSPDHLLDGLGMFTLRDLRSATHRDGNKGAIREDLIREIRRLTEATSDCATSELPGGDPNRRWTYSDIVVLCRRKTAIKELQRDLDKCGIPYVTPRTISVFTSRAAIEVRMLLWTLARPSDQRRWRTLSTSWFSWLANSGHSAGELADLCRRFGPSALHREVLGGTFLPDLLAHPGGQRHVTDVDHVFTALATAFPSGTSINEMLDWIEEAIDDAEGADDSIDGQRRIESDENAVRLMTIHASKGLQFPIVFVLDPEGMGLDPFIVTEQTPEGRTIELSSVLMSAGQRTDAMKASVIEENDRLLYVALTRAEQVLTAWIAANHGEDSTPAWRRLVDPWVSRSEGEVEAEDAPDRFPRVITLTGNLDPIATTTRVNANSGRITDVTVVPLRRSASEPNRRWSYSSLHVTGSTSEAADVDSRSGAEDETTGSAEASKGRRGYFAFGNLRGSNLGDALHGVFEHVVGHVRSDDEELDRIIEREFRAQGLTAPPNVRSTVVRLLHAPLGEPWNDRCLNDYAASELSVAAEMRFTLPISPASNGARDDALTKICRLVIELDPDGPFVDHFSQMAQSEEPGRLLQGFLSGSIDLVAPTLGEDRRYVLLDYKSNALTVTSDFSAESLAREMAASGYPLQALVYSVALHRHLSVRLRGYDAATHLGGATYFYLRGAGLMDSSEGDGIFHWAIPPALTREVSSLLLGKTT